MIAKELLIDVHNCLLKCMGDNIGQSYFFVYDSGFTRMESWDGIINSLVDFTGDPTLSYNHSGFSTTTTS